MINTIRGKWRTLLFRVAAVLLAFGATAAAQEKPDELKTLQKERRELLSDAAKMTLELYYSSQRLVDVANPTTVKDVLRSDQESLRADLEYFDKPEERIAAVEKHGEVANLLVKITEAQLNAARATKELVYQAKAYTLEIQIELLKAKKEAQKSGVKP